MTWVEVNAPHPEVFEKIKNIVENETKSETKITGDKSGVLNGLDGMLKESNKYEIIIREA